MTTSLPSPETLDILPACLLSSATESLSPAQRSGLENSSTAYETLVENNYKHILLTDNTTATVSLWFTDLLFQRSFQVRLQVHIGLPTKNLWFLLV